MCNFTPQNIPFKVPKISLKFDANIISKNNNYIIDLPCTIFSFCDIYEPQ